MDIYIYIYGYTGTSNSWNGWATAEIRLLVLSHVQNKLIQNNYDSIAKATVQTIIYQLVWKLKF